MYPKPCKTIPALGAPAALAKLCALLVATRELALAQLCARVAAAALGLLAPSMSCGRFSSSVPHAAVECLSEGLGRAGDVHRTLLDKLRVNQVLCKSDIIQYQDFQSELQYIYI